jgi:hypothetical protein
MPYNGPIVDGKWVFYASAPENPIYYLLELLWTRLHYKFGLSQKIFGEDLMVDSFHPYMKGEYLEKGDMKGWGYEYNYLTKGQLGVPLEDSEWSPTFIDETQHKILTRLAFKGQLLSNGQEIMDVLKGSNYTLETLISSLLSTEFVYQDGNSLILLNEFIVLGTYQDKFYIADNSDSRFLNWTFKNMFPPKND